MPKYLAILALTALFAVIPFPVFAHTEGTKGFVMINGQFTKVYKVPLTSQPLETNLPRDEAPVNYNINEPLNFELVKDNLPPAAGEADNLQIVWDFGDGSAKQTDLSLSHTYTKPGSYIVDVYAFEADLPNPQLIEKVLLNVLPYPEYQLPVSKIRVNGQTSKDPLTDMLFFRFDESLLFDAGLSEGKSGKLVSYFWDFGDRTGSDKQSDAHKFSPEELRVFPVLKVTDENGFVDFSFIELQNQQLQDEQNNPAKSKPGGFGQKLISIPAFLFTLFALAAVWLYKQTNT